MDMPGARPRSPLSTTANSASTSPACGSGGEPGSAPSLPGRAWPGSCAGGVAMRCSPGSSGSPKTCWPTGYKPPSGPRPGPGLGSGGGLHERHGQPPHGGSARDRGLQVFPSCGTRALPSAPAIWLWPTAMAMMPCWRWCTATSATTSPTKAPARACDTYDSGKAHWPSLVSSFQRGCRHSGARGGRRRFPRRSYAASSGWTAAT
jgi:hypothetical protein